MVARASRLHRGLRGRVEQATRLLTLLPGVGAWYERAGIPGLRRIYLAKIACHIYYTFDDDEVIIRAIWGARRGRGPFGPP